MFFPYYFKHTYYIITTHNLPVPVKEVDIHLYCPVNKSSLQQNGLCLLSLPTEQSHGRIPSFLGRDLLDVINVLYFVCLRIVTMERLILKDNDNFEFRKNILVPTYHTATTFQATQHYCTLRVIFIRVIFFKP